jgi:signal transduction histidine kinase
MIYDWTKQFLLATGLFALVLTGQTINLVLKEKRVADKQLEKASRTVRVKTESHTHLN